MRRFSLFVMLAAVVAVAAMFLVPAVQKAGTDERAAMKKIAAPLQRSLRSRPVGAQRVNVIVKTADGANFGVVRTQLESAGAQVTRQLDAVGLMTAEMPLVSLTALASHQEIAWISPDQEVTSLATSTNNTSHVEVTSGASKFLPVDNNKMADGGAGNDVGIAILDSGISPADAAEFVGYEWQTSSGLLGTGLLGQQYLASYDRIKKRVDFTGEAKSQDAYGHGTHTAGIAAGTGQSSEDRAASTPGSPTYGGTATGASLIDVRVLNSQGVGTVSSVIAGINWAIQNKSTYQIGVLNLSLGTPITQSYKTDPLCQAVAKAVDAGIVVVVAAGNWGKDSYGNLIYGGILSPANSPKVITVGAVNTQQTNLRSDDTVTTYSSRGPTLVDGLVKPDLVAPGNRTGAAETAVASPTASYDYNSTGGGGLIGGLLSGDTSTNTPQATGTYQILSGTSFAAPMVSGTVAIMLEANPSLTPAFIKAVLMRTAQRLPAYEKLIAAKQMTPFERAITEGAGELNVSAAVTIAKVIRRDANKAKLGENLITNKNLTYSTSGVTNPIAGETLPLNNGIVWVEGVAFTDRLLVTNGYQLSDGTILSSGFVIADGYLNMDGSYVFSNGYVLGTGYVLASGYVLGTGYVLGNGYVLGTGYILGSQYGEGDGTLSTGAKSGWCFSEQQTWASNMIDPTSTTSNEEEVMIQGEQSLPDNIRRITNKSKFYPKP